jgi:hypothetical protein
MSDALAPRAERNRLDLPESPNQLQRPRSLAKLFFWISWPQDRRASATVWSTLWIAAKDQKAKIDLLNYTTGLGLVVSSEDGAAMLVAPARSPRPQGRWGRIS